MKVSIYNLEKNAVGEIELDPDVFGLYSRPDIIKRVIDWQLAKRRSGTHSTKTISQVSGTTKKPHSQKGTGKARQGSLRQVHMRGGAVSHGPIFRSHEYSLTKKFKRLGLCHAISAKLSQNSMFVIDNFDIEAPKTKIVQEKLANFGFKNYFLIDAQNVHQNLACACKSLYNVNIVPQVGANVYDIMKHECLIISTDAIAMLTARLI